MADSRKQVLIKLSSIYNAAEKLSISAKKTLKGLEEMFESTKESCNELKAETDKSPAPELGTHTQIGGFLEK